MSANETAVATAVNMTIDGFSLTNRWLLYASIMLAPAQFVAGIGSNFPSSLGFLAYNWYSQVRWYQAAQARDFHALSMVIPHFNLVYAVSYMGGVASGNIVLTVLLSLGTAGVMILNDIASWVSWANNQPEGYGVYQFFFFGWRTLDENWHKFFLCWQIFDSMAILAGIATAINLAGFALSAEKKDKIPWWARYPVVPLGAAAALLFIWPLIMWTELIVSRNNIVSDTDWIAVWLFVAQVVLMMVPSFSTIATGCWGVSRSWKSSGTVSKV